MAARQETKRAIFPPITSRPSPLPELSLALKLLMSCRLKNSSAQVKQKRYSLLANAPNPLEMTIQRPFAASLISSSLFFGKASKLSLVPIIATPPVMRLP
jgi:hypothetical protein